MRVLMLHNRYQQPGGEDVAFETEAALLEDFGCEVRRYECHNSYVEQLGGVRTAFRSIWSPQTYKQIREILRHNHYDVVHVQNYFPLISPSAYFAARAEGIAVVQTLHNYRLICPAGTFCRDGKVCLDCLGKTVAWPGIIHACYRDSALATSAVAAMLSINRALGTWKNQVDVYIALTEFGRNKFIEGGLPGEKIMVKPNLTFGDKRLGDGSGGFAVFVGRLESVKGVETLLTAWRSLRGQIPLMIMGDGNLAPQVTSAAEDSPDIHYLGQCNHQEVLDTVKKAMFLVMPSHWFEGQGFVVIEAFAAGTPVIASRLGSMVETVDDQRTGLLFNPGDPDDLASKVEWAVNHPAEMQEMRKQARAKYYERYSPQSNYELLMEIYKVAMARAPARSRQ